jgi:hypothetical protein
MSRLLHRAAATAAMMIAATLLVSSLTSPGDVSGMSWGSVFAVADPDPGFWRARPRDITGQARPYSAGISSLAATTRLAVAPGHDLTVTTLGPAGAMLLERGALVVIDVKGPLAFQRAGAGPDRDRETVQMDMLLNRGDRMLHRSTATVTLRNLEATTASLLLTTEITDPSRFRAGRAQ